MCVNKFYVNYSFIIFDICLYSYNTSGIIFSKNDDVINNEEGGNFDEDILVYNI